MNNKTDMIMSVPVSCVPFMEYSDGTRLNMSANQMRQSLDVFSNEMPLVRSGMENYYRDMSSLTIRSSYNGTILFVDNRLIVIKMDSPIVDNYFDVIELNGDYMLTCTVGEHTKPGDVLARKLAGNGSLKSIVNGVNLLTAITPYYGFNYEDGIVISESCAEKLSHEELKTVRICLKKDELLLSLKNDKYTPLLSKGDRIVKGDVIASVKNASLKNMNNLISQPKRYLSDADGIVDDIRIYINEYPDVSSEFSRSMLAVLRENEKKLAGITSTIIEEYNKVSEDHIESLPSYILRVIESYSTYTSKRPFYNNEREYGVIIEYVIKEKHHFNIGDKLSNRYGNKGVVTLIVPDDKILKVNGVPVDIIINIMGLVGRMNMQSHLLELWASAITMKVRAICKYLVINKRINDALEVIKDFYDCMDNSETKFIAKGIDYSLDIKTLINDLAFYAPPFIGTDIYKMKELLKKYNVPDVVPVYDPSYGGKRNMAAGYIYWEKLKHLSEKKIDARSFGKYDVKTKQPSSHSGAQRLGEMEVWALLEHDAADVLFEALSIKSDDIASKRKAIFDMINGNPINLPESMNSRVSDLFKTYIRSMGLDIARTEDDK